MNQEIPKPENIEDGTDLYDGMIFEALSDVDYIASLDYFTLNKLKERLGEYYKIMGDVDYTKGEKLTARLGAFINKYNLKSMLDHVTFLINKENNKLDNIDTVIISFMDNHEVLDEVGYNELLALRRRLIVYYSIIASDNEEMREELFERLGHYLAVDSVKGMLDYVDGLLGGDKVSE